MLKEADYLEALRRYKNKKLNGHERQRYHALGRGACSAAFAERGTRELGRLLEQEAMPVTEVGSGWTIKAICSVIEERFEFETYAMLSELSEQGTLVTPLAGDQSKVYLEGTVARRWNPIGQQPLIADGSRSKESENIYGAIHLGTGEEVTPLVIDWQDSDATICWFEQVLLDCPRGQIVLWLDRAPHHTSEEVEEWLLELAQNLGEKLPSEPDPAALNTFLLHRKAIYLVHSPDISLAVIKLMGRGEYMVERPGDPDQGHFGLAVHDYTHSTAPNRRYADLVTQRLVKAVLTGQPSP